MSDAVTKFREALVARVLTGPGDTSPAQRRAAFDHTTSSDPALAALLDTVTRNAWKVTDEEVESAKAAGVSEDQIFELVVCAAIGQSTRQHDSVLAVVDQAFAGVKS